MKSSYRLCLITKNGTNPADEGARIGAGRVARRLGCTLVNRYPVVPDDVVEQQALIEAALNERPDAIVLSPVHPTRLEPVIRNIERSGVPLVYVVNGCENVGARTLVTSNNRALAVAVGNCLFDLMRSSGDVAIIEGSPNSPTSLPRTEGFMHAASRHPGIRVVSRRSGFYQRDHAHRAMAQILAEHPEIAGVLCANDFMALGVVDAMAEAKRDTPIVGVNAMPDAIEAIKAGRMQATASFDAMKMACVATEAAVRILSGETVPDRIELPVEIVDAGNCDAWDRPYEARPLPVWEDLFSRTLPGVSS